MTVTLHRGLPGHHRAAAAALYWQAFGGKLGRVLGPDARAEAYLARVIDPHHAIHAEENGKLVGLAGFKSPSGALADGSLRDLAACYGWIGAGWRMALMMALMREVDNHHFLIDGICVAPDCRSRGIGAALVTALCTEAQSRGYEMVRLEVIDTNLRARALYERLGFQVTARERLGLLSHAFGFRDALTMVRPVSGQAGTKT